MPFMTSNRILLSDGPFKQSHFSKFVTWFWHNCKCIHFHLHKEKCEAFILNWLKYLLHKYWARILFPEPGVRCLDQQGGGAQGVCPAWTCPRVTAPPPPPLHRGPSGGSGACQSRAIPGPWAQHQPETENQFWHQEPPVPGLLQLLRRDSRQHLAGLTASKVRCQEVRKQL